MVLLLKVGKVMKRIDTSFTVYFPMTKKQFSALLKEDLRILTHH
jgi:hypothetical protein